MIMNEVKTSRKGSLGFSRDKSHTNIIPSHKLQDHACEEQNPLY